MQRVRETIPPNVRSPLETLDMCDPVAVHAVVEKLRFANAESIGQAELLRVAKELDCDVLTVNRALQVVASERRERLRAASGRRQSMEAARERVFQTIAGASVGLGVFSAVFVMALAVGRILAR